MTLALTPETLAGAYDYLCATEPFKGWNLPASEDVAFSVVRSPSLRGWYKCVSGKHVIAISSRCIGFSDNLIRTMAHEMVHLHQRDSRMETNGEHNAAFLKLAARICSIHGFDPKLF